MKLRSSSLVIAFAAACGGKAAPPAAPANPEPVRIAAPPCTAATAVSTWLPETGADFEDIALDDDGTFTSHLHARPFEVGRWAIDGTALVLEASDGTTTRIEDARCATSLTGTSRDEPLEWKRYEPAGP